MTTLFAAEMPELRKPVNMHVWGKSVFDVIRQINQQARIGLITANIPEAELRNRIVYLHATQIPSIQAVEMIASALRCRYRITGANEVILTASYDFLSKSQPKLISQPVEVLLGQMRTRASLESLEQNLHELTKICFLYPGIYTARLIPDVTTDGEIRAQFTASVPPLLHTRLLSALRAMNTSGKTLLPPPIIPKESIELQEFREFLNTSVRASWNGWTLEDVVKELSSYGKIINFGFDQTGVPPQRITLNIGETTLIDAIQKISQSLGFGGYEIIPPNTIWLTREKRSGQVRFTRELLWELLELESFSIPEILARRPPDAVIRHLKTTVEPDCWTAPSAALFVHEPSQNLITIAPEPVIQKIHIALIELQQSIAPDEPLRSAVTGLSLPELLIENTRPLESKPPLNTTPYNHLPKVEYSPLKNQSPSDFIKNNTVKLTAPPNSISHNNQAQSEDFDDKSIYSPLTNQLLIP